MLDEDYLFIFMSEKNPVILSLTLILSIENMLITKMATCNLRVISHALLLHYKQENKQKLFCSVFYVLFTLFQDSLYITNELE